MDTKTLESQPANNGAALRTPSVINYHDTVRRNAKRKADNGSQFSSTKGKTSLLLCVVDDVRSQLGMAKFDENNQRIQLSTEHFDKCKEAISKFWESEAQSMVSRAIEHDAKITTRHGVLMSRIGKNDTIVRSKTDKFTAVYIPSAKEHKLCDTIGHTAAVQRLDVMLDNVGKWSRDELNAQKRKVELLEAAVNNTGTLVPEGASE